MNPATSTAASSGVGEDECMYAKEHSFLDPEELKSKDDMTFCIKNYPSRTLRMMSIMRQHKMLTDVTLEVGTEKFHAHKVVLSAASPYFKAMFTGGLKECEMSKVNLQGVCPTAMGRIIYFIYTGHIRVTEVTVCQILPAATMLQVPDVIEACCTFLERQLEPANAIGIANFAEQHGCTDLNKKANSYIERFFNRVCKEDEFLQLQDRDLLTLIQRDKLNVNHESDVYNAVLDWVKYDQENRCHKLECIMYAIRCQKLTPNFIKEQIKKCDVLKKVPACRDYLSKVFKDLTLHKLCPVKERTPNTNRIIFVAGGFFKQSLDSLEGYNVDDRTWQVLPKLRIPRSGLGALLLYYFVFIIYSIVLLIFFCKFKFLIF